MVAYTDIGPAAGAYGHGLYGAGFYGGAIAYGGISDPSTAYSDVAELTTPTDVVIDRMGLLLFGFDVPTELNLVEKEYRMQMLTWGFRIGTGTGDFGTDVSKPSTAYSDVGITDQHLAYDGGQYGDGQYGGWQEVDDP